MVARKFLVRHDDSAFAVDYDTDDGFEVFQFQIFSLTSIPPEDQKIIGEGNDRIVSDDSSLAAVSEKLRLVSIAAEEERKLEKQEETTSNTAGTDTGYFDAGTTVMSDEELARMLQYEDPVRQEAARKTVPADNLEEKALVSLAKEGNLNPSKIEQDHAFLLQLLFWFKRSFSWVHAPPCDGCGNETDGQGMGDALPSEIQYGATRVELYCCNTCSRVTRFPRYNDPLKLVETRKGRCGEWANCFTLYCRAFGYESRLVLDFTDHVWTECYSEVLGRWMHLDPCEAIYDRPLLYEKGWEKKLNYIIAIAKDGVYDVTKRYTRKWDEVLSRRTLTTESSLVSVLASMTKECRRDYTSQVLSVLEERDNIEREALERDSHSTDDASILLPGRQSGSLQWRIARSEFGTDSLSSSSCPVRMCRDEHVTRIYNAFSAILHKFVEDSLIVSKGVEVLKIFRATVVDLKKLPYKERRASLKSNSIVGTSLMHHLLPSFNELLNALSLKSELDTNGIVSVCLAGDPVETALALPVALHALDELISDLSKCYNFSKGSLSFPLLRLNRICSGAVLASGEELPFGIATAAFDGTRMSKWVEPSGAKGCYIMYKLSGSIQELVAYELMSANDAPERDPMNWVVEGSNDGGSSWHALDEQTSQVFDKRFQRKTYKIRSTGFLSNIFRFRFLAVRDVESTSRLQVGSIDLYASLS
ncbi:peptide-N(4)-(N-acetyl-beta-glucosaminyl)asparagine amidase isoform X2 [Durio zibethinus]|uniref:Peptide-N(4)-(N-acetyl-beta- glucosaminyl)asparagine amidase isoform X2 n=1 Tax=Durio zibethinus TaxID=66656 RepID=A0A6P5WU29_DURZI|nr:peptide-N(4)-(N-acetyl-beta-glucosaminyl)asparagine amidase isoform X2 [Durio zibethinus]